MEIKRTDFLKTAIGATVGVVAAATASPWYSEAEAAIGNFPAGTTGPSIFVGLCTPFTGSYSADGEDQHKGFVLAVEDLNNGTGVMAKIPSLAGKKGLLEKKIVYKVADSETKPNVAVERATEFITQNQAILIVGGLASSSDIALEKLAQQQKVLYMMG
ncbi:MAG: ABC transporter substrate-binding protein, partial [Candidatus Saccharimonadales bacterium]